MVKYSSPDDIDKFFKELDDAIKKDKSEKNKRDLLNGTDNPFIIDTKDNKLYFTLDATIVKSANDIIISVTKKQLRLDCTIEGIKGCKEFMLPVDVKPGSTKSTLINGILDVIMDIDENKK